MPVSGWLSSEKVAALREELGRDLRAEEGAAFRARVRMNKQSALPSAPASAVPGPEIVTLPPVGRHTHALEQQLSETRVRKPSLPDTPDLKKPKLEPRDESMCVEPGEPINSQSAEADVDLPTSPHFARDIPHFDLTTDGGAKPDTTQREEDDDSDVCKVHDDDRDELTKANAAANDAHTLPPGTLIHNDAANLIHNSLPAEPQPGAGISKWAFGLPSTNNSSGVPNNLGGPVRNVPPSGYAHFQGAPEVMPPWVQETRDGFFGLHQKADAIHQEMSNFGAEVQAHGVRLSTLERVAEEHTNRHEKSDARIKALESKIEELLAQADRHELGARSPARTGLGG